MGKIENNIIRVLENSPGLSDREIADAVSGHGSSARYINQYCRTLVTKGVLQRKKREDNLIGNWLIEDEDLRKVIHQTTSFKNVDDISEKKIKQVLEIYLTTHGWVPEIAWGITHGIDIDARRGAGRWVIEVKGSRLFNPDCINYFVSVLGEILQRMDDPSCKYSIALPDLEQFRRLWDRMPALAKARTGITALFVSLTGTVTELEQ